MKKTNAYSRARTRRRPADWLSRSTGNPDDIPRAAESCSPGCISVTCSCMPRSCGGRGNIARRTLGGQHSATEGGVPARTTAPWATSCGVRCRLAPSLCPRIPGRWSRLRREPVVDCPRRGPRRATRSKQNVTRSATLTVPAGPPLYGLIPKSVCLAVKLPVALMLSEPTVTSAVTGTFRVTPAIVTASCSSIFPLFALSESAAKVISGYLSTCRTSSRMASVTWRISAVSGGVSTSRLSVGTLSRSEDAGAPGR